MVVKTDEAVFKNEKGEVWYFYEHEYMFYVADHKIDQMAKRWKEAEHVATYWYPDGRICNQYKIPAKLKQRVIAALKGTYRNSGTDLKKVSHFKQANFQISDSEGIKSERVYDVISE